MQTKPYIIYLKTHIKSRTKTKKGQIYITITKKTQMLIDFYEHNNNNVSEIDCWKTTEITLCLYKITHQTEISQ